MPPGLDQYVDSVMKAFGVPGISLTIVKDGKVIVAKGYGVRRLGDPTPVDAGTLFGIASNTRCSPRSRSACWWNGARSSGTRR